MIARSLIILVLAASLAQSGEPKTDDAAAKAKTAVEKQLKDWKADAANSAVIDEKYVRDVSPGHTFVAVRFPLFPVQRIPPEPLKSQNLFAVTNDGKVTHLPDSKKLEEFFKSTLKAQT